MGRSWVANPDMAKSAFLQAGRFNNIPAETTYGPILSRYTAFAQSSGPTKPSISSELSVPQHAVHPQGPINLPNSVPTQQNKIEQSWEINKEVEHSTDSTPATALTGVQFIEINPPNNDLSTFFVLDEGTKLPPFVGPTICQSTLMRA